MKRRGRRRNKKGSQLSRLIAKIRKPQILIGAGIVLVVLLIAILAISFTKKSSTEGVRTHHALYFKQSENTGLSYVDAEDGKTKQMTDMLLYGNSMDVLALERTAETYKGLVQTSANGERVFFPVEMKKTDNFKLYYRDVNKKDSPAVVLAADVSSYKISDDGKLVTYKLNDGMLYQHDLNERTQVSNQVSAYYVSEDGKQVVYTTLDRKAYWYQNGKSSEIGKEISAINAFSEDGKTVYYTKEQTLYVKQKGKDAVKIDSDVSAVHTIYNSGEIYYVKQSSVELALKDYVENDAQVATEIKSAVEANKLEWNSYELFYYDGAKTKSIAKNVDYEDMKTATDRAVVMYSVCDMKNAEKVKISTIPNTWSIDSTMNSVIASAKSYQVAVKGKATSIEQKGIHTVCISKNGNTIYFVADVVGKQEGSSLVFGTLYKIEVSKDGAKKAKEYDTEVYVNNIGFAGKDGVFYYKKVQQVSTFFQGELYVNKACASEKAKVGSAICYQETGSDTVYFIDSWKYQKSMGAFQKFENGKTINIFNAAHSFHVTPAGEVLFIGKYNVDTFTGALYLYEADTTTKVDDGVIAIINQNK